MTTYEGSAIYSSVTTFSTGAWDRAEIKGPIMVPISSSISAPPLQGL
jgi:hypothetical protein